jgi:hypothetical protein
MIQIFVSPLAGRWLRHLGRRLNGGLSGMICEKSSRSKTD